MRRSKLNVPVHFVWATWDRLPLVTEAIERPLYRYIKTVCRDDECDVLAIGGMPDHVHLLVLLSNTITLGQLMHDVKGGSSRFLSRQVLSGDWFAWQRGYGAFGVSPQDKQRVIRYILNQKRHHTDGTVWPEAEEIYEELPPPEPHSPTSAVSAQADTRPKAP